MSTPTVSNTSSDSSAPTWVRQSIRQSGIYAVGTLAIMIVLVWAPLRFGLPAIAETGEITVTGAGYVLWLVTTMAAVVAFAVGTVLGLSRILSRPTLSIAPMLGCTVAGFAFCVVSHNVPIW